MLKNPSGEVLWQTDEVNARGQVTKAKLGNGIAVVNDYDSHGYVTNIKHTLGTSTVMELGTLFDTQRGNLKSRTNSMFGTSDVFGYDAQDRLISYPNALGAIENQTYEVDGRIKANTLGTYNYTNTAKKYQNTSVTLTPEATGYYANREGVYNDSMESKNSWNFGRAHNPQCVSYDDTKVHTNPGKTSLRINTTGQTVAYIHSIKNIAINNSTDTQYTISGRVYSDGPTAQLTLFMLKEGETGYFTNVDSQPSTTTGQWTTITKNIIVPANIRTLNLRLDNVGTGNVWFDDVMIRKTANTALSSPTYQDRQLNITYNTFKSPVDISEAGVDKISFTYNDGNDRSVMFYGGLGDKSTRQYRKHYSADGTMEIKENLVAQTVEFVTYLGGDGYSAPVVVKSDGITQNYLYLHRDYQGSILAITNNTGQVLEKRLFDAWGAIVKVQDGAGNTLAGLTILDRGYTGHEHLQSVGLIHMNGRLYDPKLHRFLQPDNYVQDPSNTQNYNRYGYCINNPLKYTDPSGEFTWSDLVAAVAIVVGVVIVIASAGTLTPVAQWLIGAGVAHFLGTFASYMNNKAAGWDAASNYIGLSSPTININTGWGDSKTPKTGVNEKGDKNEVVKKPEPEMYLSSSEKDEPPVNLFPSGNSVFNGVANSRAFKTGDGKFSLFAHGAPGFILDQANGIAIKNAKDFDRAMSLMNNSWNSAKDNRETTLSLWSCQSATVDKMAPISMAQMISQAHPNIIVTGADGYVNYNNSSNGYRINRIENHMGSGKNDGWIVAYKNGIEVYRRRF
jgi:RHS repeat-associated protein